MYLYIHICKGRGLGRGGGEGGKPLVLCCKNKISKRLDSHAVYPYSLICVIVALKKVVVFNVFIYFVMSTTCHS